MLGCNNSAQNSSPLELSINTGRWYICLDWGGSGWCQGCTGTWRDRDVMANTATVSGVLVSSDINTVILHASP